MKNIAIWKVVLLTLVTGGLYAIYWAGRNRDYLEKSAPVSKKLPSWVWLLAIPITFAVGCVAMFCIFLAGYGGALSTETAGFWVIFIEITVTVLVIAIGLWRLWYFGKSFEKVTQGRMNRTVTLLLYVFMGPFVIAFQQYYINRLGENKKGEVYKTGGGLLLLVCIAGLLSAISLVLSMYSLSSTVKDFETEVHETQTTVQEIQTQQSEVDRLNKEYMACIDTLNKTYPGEEVQPGEEAAYIEAYDTCDAIYKEYESAYDAFMKE